MDKSTLSDIITDYFSSFKNHAIWQWLMSLVYMPAISYMLPVMYHRCDYSERMMILLPCLYRQVISEEPTTAITRRADTSIGTLLSNNAGGSGRKRRHRKGDIASEKGGDPVLTKSNIAADQIRDTSKVEVNEDSKPPDTNLAVLGAPMLTIMAVPIQSSTQHRKQSDKLASDLLMPKTSVARSSSKLTSNSSQNSDSGKFKKLSGESSTKIVMSRGNSRSTVVKIPSLLPASDNLSLIKE